MYYSLPLINDVSEEEKKLEFAYSQMSIGQIKVRSKFEIEIKRSD